MNSEGLIERVVNGESPSDVLELTEATTIKVDVEKMNNLFKPGPAVVSQQRGELTIKQGDAQGIIINEFEFKKSSRVGKVEITKAKRTLGMRQELTIK